jgi:hypothetical protein
VIVVVRPTASGDRADHDERLHPLPDRVGQGDVRRIVGQVLLTREEPDERPPAQGAVIADGPAQHRVPGLERVQDGALCGRAVDLHERLSVELRQRPQVGREHHADHGKVWTSTERTDGKSLAIGAQVSPASTDAYTCPPVVPKYTPHESSESTAMASRSTLT